MKRIMQATLMFFLLLSFVAQAKAESQNTDSVGKEIVAEAEKGGYKLISPEELKEEYLKDPASFSLVDVRQEWSYQMQHIKGALHIDFAPTWWNQHSPMMRADMKRLLGPGKDRKFVFY